MPYRSFACAEREHEKCNRQGWDTDDDKPCLCPCACHDHRHRLVLDVHQGWQCSICGIWKPLDYRG